MKILVCVKHIADVDAVQDGAGLQPSGLNQMPNPLDLSAIEEALQVRALTGGEVTALTVGPSQAERTLSKALMMGANRALRLWDEGLQGAEATGVALVLARAAQKLGFDLLLCGARSADSGSETIGALLAEHLGLPLICRAIRLRFDRVTNRIVADKKLEKGARETYAAPMPAILTIERGIEPRYSSSNWVHRLLKERSEVLNLRDIGMSEALPPPRVRSIALMPPKPRTKIGVKLSGLSLKDKLAVMRGRANNPQREALVSDRPEDAAKKIKKHLDRWLE